MADVTCPLDPHVKLRLGNRMNLARVMDIEMHKSTGACVHPELKDIILHGDLDGCTPLLLACGEGQLASLKRIVEGWGADLNAAGIYYHLHQDVKVKILGATPLIIASLKGHSDIVEYLISRRANVSATASTEGGGRINLLYDVLNPLRGALIDDRPGQSFSEKCAESSEIVRRLLAAGANPNTLDARGKPVWAMRFCGIDATIALVERELNLNQPTSKGKTILHHWIKFEDYNKDFTEQERSDIIQYLADRGANLSAKDANGFTPILLAAESSRLCILEGLLARENIDRSEKVVAMELAGSHLLTPHNLDVEKAFGYWRRALKLKEGTDPVNKFTSLMSSGRVIEWVTSSEVLEKVFTRPEEYWVQSMLTRLRIYSEKRLKAVDSFLLDYFVYIDLHPGEYDYEESCFYGLAPPSEYDVATVMLAVLEAIPLFHPGEKELPRLTRVLEELFLILERDDPFFTKENISSSMQLVLAVDPNFLATLPYAFFVILAGLPEALSHGSFREYLSHAARQDAGTLLSEACNLKDWKTLRFLLHLGADANAIDDRRIDPPFHTAVIREAHRTVLQDGQEQLSNEMQQNSLTHLLFNYGANPYRINHEGKTAVDVWVEKYCGEEGMESEAWNRRPHWCRDTVPKLSCLAAKTIHTHAIAYSHPNDLPENHPNATPEVIPKILYNFLEKN